MVFAKWSLKDSFLPPHIAPTYDEVPAEFLAASRWIRTNQRHISKTMYMLAVCVLTAEASLKQSIDDRILRHCHET